MIAFVCVNILIIMQLFHYFSWQDENHLCEAELFFPRKGIIWAQKSAKSHQKIALDIWLQNQQTIILQYLIAGFKIKSIMLNLGKRNAYFRHYQ